MKTILFNPFEKYNENKLLLFGLLITIIGSLLGYLFQGRFDGVLDLHFPGKVTLLEPFIDNVINAVTLFCLLFLLGKYINPKTRLIDIITVVLIARAPLYLLTFSNYKNFSFNLGQKILTQLNPQNLKDGLNLEASEMILTIAIAGISILFTVWFIILLFNGFKVATNSKGVKNNLMFAGSLLFAEIISKIIFTLL